jgi:hypothetical protein
MGLLAGGALTVTARRGLPSAAEGSAPMIDSGPDALSGRGRGTRAKAASREARRAGAALFGSFSDSSAWDGMQISLQTP